MSNEMVLYLYAILVGLEIGRWIYKPSEGKIISLTGICGYLYLILFNNPGHSDLDYVMYIICTASAMCIACLSYITWKREESLLDILYQERHHEQVVRNPVQRCISPQGVEDLLQRQERIRRNIGNTEGCIQEANSGKNP